MMEATVYLCSPTNSQMFTTCCNTAICEDEKNCPACGKPVLGHDESSNHQRGVRRWRYAYGRQKKELSR